MKRDGLVRASVIAKRLDIPGRLVRRWLRSGYIEGIVHKRSYWVMLREGRITVLDDRIQLGRLDVT